MYEEKTINVAIRQAVVLIVCLAAIYEIDRVIDKQLIQLYAQNNSLEREIDRHGMRTFVLGQCKK